LHFWKEGATVSKYWYLLYAIPCVALLTPMFFNSDTPELAGMPFFYWYQFLWLVLTGGAMVGIALLRRRGRGAL
jgi:hypothetical protein